LDLLTEEECRRVWERFFFLFWDGKKIEWCGIAV
jgi:hypothetical protein